jgi:hypothetical protein
MPLMRHANPFSILPSAFALYFALLAASYSLTPLLIPSTAALSGSYVHRSNGATPSTTNLDISSRVWPRTSLGVGNHFLDTR